MTIDLIASFKFTKHTLLLIMVVDIFLSYAWGEKNGEKSYKNQNKVKTLQSYFQKNYDWKCWMDIDQIVPGTQLLEKIEEGIRECKVFIAIITQEQAFKLVY